MFSDAITVSTNSLVSCDSLARAAVCRGTSGEIQNSSLSRKRRGRYIIGAVYTHCPALPCPLPCRTALLPHTAAQLPWPARSPTCPGCETHTVLLLLLCGCGGVQPRSERPALPRRAARIRGGPSCDSKNESPTIEAISYDKGRSSSQLPGYEQDTLGCSDSG